jgi:Ca2+-binding EF-hand superfamily protein
LSSFKAVDLDNSQTLDVRELKTLLWLCNGEEPSDQRVKYEIRLMDINHDGMIDFFEWMKYLTIPSENGSPSNKMNIKGSVFNYGLKMKFDMYDINNDGSISLDELYLMLHDTFL